MQRKQVRVIRTVIRVVARYGRISKKEKARDSEALKRQLFRLDRQILADGFELNPDLLFEDEQSGREDNRPDFQRVLELVKSGKIDRLYIARADRITRDLEMNGYLAKLFERTGVELYELRKGRAIDWDNPADWHDFAQAGIRAEGESRELARRVRDALEYNRHHGYANQAVPFGWIRSPLTKKYERHPDLQVQAQVLRMFEILKDEENSTLAARRVEIELGKYWTIGGLTRWALNPIHRGDSPYGRVSHATDPDQHWSEIRPGTHTELAYTTLEAQEELASLLLKNRGLKRADVKFVYTLTGLLICENCGRSMRNSRVSRKEKDYFYVYCRTRQIGMKSSPCYDPAKNSARKGKPKRGIEFAHLESQVITALCDRSRELAEYALMVQTQATEKQTSPEALKVQAQITQIENLIAQIGDSEGAFTRQISKLRASLHDRGSEQDLALKEQLISQGSDPDYWRELTPLDRRFTFRAFIRRVLVRDGKVSRIEFKV